MERLMDARKKGSAGGVWAGLGALICSLTVVLAAVGDHLVAGAVNPHALRIYDIANRFQFYQGVGLILLGLAIGQRGARWTWTWTGVLLLFGAIFFSGGLYLVALLGQAWAFLAPIGGTAMIVSWLLFAYSFWRRP